MSQHTFGSLCQSEWAGCLVVPLRDRFGEIVDVGFIHLDRDPSTTMRCLRGATETGVVAYGLDRVLTRKSQSSQSAEQQTLILVEEVIDALTLQTRGFWNVAAVGALDEMTPHRWDALHDLGFSQVRILFRNAAAQPALVRHFLTTRDGAVRCPEVHVFDSTQIGPGESASEFVIRQGREALRRLMEGRSFVRRQWVEPEFSRHTKAPHRPWYAFQPERYWEAVNHRLHTMIHRAEHDECRHMASDVAEALGCGRFDEAHQILDQWPIDRRHRPASVSPAMCDVISVAAAIDAVCEPTHNAESLTWNTEPSLDDVTIIRATNARTCQERLIDALLSDLRADDDGLKVVVCEGDLRQFVTLLVHRMADEQAHGDGLSVAEVVDRLHGDEPSGGFREKPWFVDEAVDRICNWTDQLCFIERPHTTAALLTTLETLHLQRGPLAGVYLDVSDNAEEGILVAGTHSESLWHQLSHDFDCPVVAAVSESHHARTPHTSRREPVNGTVAHRRETFTANHRPNIGAGSRDAYDFRSLLRHWIIQTERRTRFDQPTA